MNSSVMDTQQAATQAANLSCILVAMLHRLPYLRHWVYTLDQLLKTFLSRPGKMGSEP
jgi:hypothetical protein